MKRRKLPAYVHRKPARGRVYYYFNTGRKTAKGKLILVRLPDYASNGFPKAYAACLEAREAGLEPMAELTVPEFCEKFRRSPRFKSRAKGTQESYLTYLKVIEDQMDTMLAEDVEPKDVLALMQKMESRPGAANQTVRTLSALYAWGSKPEVGLVKHNPAARIDLYEGGEHDPWPEWLLAKGLKASDQRVRLAINLLYYTAARIGDVARLRWSDIDDGVLSYVPQKTKRKNPEPLVMRLHRDLLAMLATVSKGVHTTIIARPDGKPYTDGTIREWLQEFGRKHGVEVVPHGLRKNAVNALLEAGCSVAQTQAISGQTLQVIEHYARKRNKRKLAGAAVALWEGKAGT